MGRTGDMKPISRDAYDKLAERYADLSGSKIENAYLDRPEFRSCRIAVAGFRIETVGRDVKWAALVC
jgi:hypothetical protein